MNKDTSLIDLRAGDPGGGFNNFENSNDNDNDHKTNNTNKNKSEISGSLLLLEHESDSSTPPSPAPVQSNLLTSDHSEIDTESKSESPELDLSPDEKLFKQLIFATQYGNIQPCRTAIEDGFDLNLRDDQNATLLHWAAINNRVELANYFIAKGAIVDIIGGNMDSTPLHWAVRQNHLQMVICLLQHHANPTLLDNGGMNCLHISAQLGYTSILAYIIAKGYNINVPDNTGMTPLMWACTRQAAIDPTQLLLTLGASIHATDNNRNTALHYALLSRNVVSINLLLELGANLCFKNSAGDSPMDIAEKFYSQTLYPVLVEKKKVYDSQKPITKFKINSHIEISVPSLKDPRFRYYVMALVPWLGFYFFGKIMQSNFDAAFKSLSFMGVLITLMVLARFVFDHKNIHVLAISLYLATKMWLYITFFQYYTFLITPFFFAIFLLITLWLFYNFFQCWLGDPGYIPNTRDDQIKTIIDLAEHEGFSPKWFCSTCLIKKPLRSKHCNFCKRCIARFDHHCPWISNCVGSKNHKYFLHYLVSLSLILIFFIYSTVIYWKSLNFDDQSANELNQDPNVKFWASAFRHNGWITWCFFNACLHILWVFFLLNCQFYQIFILGMTTNERINHERYSHFKVNKKTGNVRNPFHYSLTRNCLEYCDCKFLHSSCYKIEYPDWRYVYNHTEILYDSDDSDEESLFQRNNIQSNIDIV